MDVFPSLSRKGMLVFTSKQTGISSNLSVAVMEPNNHEYTVPFDTFVIKPNPISIATVAGGAAGCFQPSWSSDEEWITFGLGNWFESRASNPGWIYRTRSDGSCYEQLTFNSSNSGPNAGYPS